MSEREQEALPVDAVLPQVLQELAARSGAVLIADPGAGKTTRVPLALRHAPWLEARRIVMLEPRRLAARAVATWMARSLGETVGQTVGYRIRHETTVGPQTRIEVVTEGILTRMLQHDPSLADYGCVIFDEFHERSLHADLGMALTLDARRLFRPDLRVLVMSATLDGARVAALLGEAPIITCEGRRYPVDVRYLDRPRAGFLDQAVAETIRKVLREESGGLLVFLPGMGDIRRVERRLHEYDLGQSVLVAPLHGDLPQAEQERAIGPPSSGQRKVVLATSIAETSVTIADVRIVLDAGYQRVARFDPRSGLTRLETSRVTKDSAEQRCGRAGRTAPGICVRLWSAVEHQGLLPRRSPEIVEADLTALLLELAVWGADDVAALAWLDVPPAGALAQARQLLRQLGALGGDGTVTAHGRDMAELGLHPRLAHMLLIAQRWHRGADACDLAALLSERDILRSSGRRAPVDVRVRLDLMMRGAAGSKGELVNPFAMDRARRSAERWKRGLARQGSGQAKAGPSRRPEGTPSIGALLAQAYPDRIAQRLPLAKGEAPRFRLANGRGAWFPEPDALGSEEFIVVAELDGGGDWARIALAAPIMREELERYCPESICTTDLIEWDDRSQEVLTRRRRHLGEIVLEDRGLAHPDAEAVRAAFLLGIQRVGLSCLRFSSSCEQWRARLLLLRRLEGGHAGAAGRAIAGGEAGATAGARAGWPDVSDEALMATLGDWLGPYVDGLRRLDQLAQIDMEASLRGMLSWKQQEELDRQMPTHLVVPSGSRIRLDYTAGAQPVLAVRLQEMFGCRETPCVANGRVPLLIHLLSPAGRPVQVTQDLAGFWSTSYFAVRKDLRGRYPKHPWPDDPLTALPTRRAKRAGP